MMDRLVADDIPNIRFNVAKSLEVVAQTLGKLPEGPDVSQQRIIPAVETLKNDSDADVRYFANRALQQALRAASAGKIFFVLLFYCLNSFTASCLTWKMMQLAYLLGIARLSQSHISILYKR